jgi:hypothetical protein
VQRIQRTDHGFSMLLEDGQTLRASRVVVAAGIARFARVLAQFEGLPADRVSHTAHERDLSRYAGRYVAVIGAGQSALESAALLQERGAAVEIIARAEQIHWLDQRCRWLKSPANPLRPLLYPPTDVGPPVLNQIVAAPGLFKRLPAAWQEWVAYRSIRPAGAGWLVPRMKGVRFTLGRKVTEVRRAGGQLVLELDDGSERRPDDVLLATGYRVDIAHYEFLPQELLQEVACTNGYPRLNAMFESTLPGLHFVGAPAAMSFGPICRFVCGTTYTSQALARGLRPSERRWLNWPASRAAL